MPKTNSTVKSVRIDNDVLAELEDKLAGQSINSWLNEQIKEYIGGKPHEGENVNGVNPCDNRVNPADKSPYLREIEDMVSVSGITMEEFYESIALLMNQGKLEITKGDVSIVYPDYMIGFIDACHDLCIPVEKAGESAVKALRKGQI